MMLAKEAFQTGGVGGIALGNELRAILFNDAAHGAELVYGERQRPIPYALLAEKHRTVVLVTHKNHYDEICWGKDHHADQGADHIGGSFHHQRCRAHSVLNNVVA